jgi:hypothetical protein
MEVELGVLSARWRDAPTPWILRVVGEVDVVEIVWDGEFAFAEAAGAG